jgi:anthraniloyl-CoA monooxygenase
VGPGDCRRRRQQPIREARREAFGVQIDERANRFVWLGTAKLFDAFTFAFEETAAGWIWAHAYRFADDCSTFIVECAPATWAALGFDAMSQEETIAACEAIFARHLDGHRLISNAAHLRGSAAWLKFRRLTCERWNDGNVVLIGDAAHTAHFSIGSGTKLAVEDAIKLADVLNQPGKDAGRGAGRLSGRALDRSAQAPEQRAQLDRMVRGGRALSRLRAVAIRLFVAHPLAAHQP